MRKAKRLTEEQILGEKGVSLIGKRFLDMGFPWHPTNAPLDAGIDGHVELRDVSTGAATNTWLAVQSKARSSLEKETDHTFEFTCTARDLDYWRRGNMPVLLVVVRPATDDAWWVSVKDYFKDPARSRSRRIVFDKQQNRLCPEAGGRLLSLAHAAGSGTYFRPAPKKEHLDLNLLQVTRLPSAIYRAQTEYRDPADLHRKLKSLVEYPAREWWFHDTAIYSVHDLRDAPWTQVCDVGTVESFDISEWADSDDPDLRRRFVWVLNDCLECMVGRMGMRKDKDGDVLYFKAKKDLSPRTKTYGSRRMKATRVVFSEYRSKRDPSRILFYRHTGFEPWFRQFDGKWCLEINPTYRFTSDGKALHPYHQEYLSKIRAIEGSGAVGHSVVMFASLLRDREGLFAARENYQHLGFGQLLGVDLDVGINDQLWAARREGQSAPGDIDPEDADAVVDSALPGGPTLFSGEEV